VSTFAQKKEGPSPFEVCVFEVNTMSPVLQANPWLIARVVLKRTIFLLIASA
jgi:hypothetical protein